MEPSGIFEELSIDNMFEDLEQYYEAAGFTDFYQRELKYKTEDEIRELYRSTFDDKKRDKRLSKGKIINSIEHKSHTCHIYFVSAQQ